MTEEKYKILKSIVNSSNDWQLNTVSTRKSLAKKISIECNIWEPNVSSFVEEMKGLSFSSNEEKNIFLEFAQVAFKYEK
jgi:hypothetical protein